jgi:hypothetical protein
MNPDEINSLVVNAFKAHAGGLPPEMSENFIGDYNNIILAASFLSDSQKSKYKVYLKKDFQDELDFINADTYKRCCAIGFALGILKLK